jgi:hypothetical protein
MPWKPRQRILSTSCSRGDFERGVPIIDTVGMSAAGIGIAVVTRVDNKEVAVWKWVGSSCGAVINSGVCGWRVRPSHFKVFAQGLPCAEPYFLKPSPLGLETP